MKTLIAIPCMSHVPTGFMSSLLGMYRPSNAQFAITEATVVHSARNILANVAVQSGCDRILWIDSDMRVPGDLLRRLTADADEGMEFVCGLYFRRTIPTDVTIYSDILEKPDGTYKTALMRIYPKDTRFKIAGCGFGAVLMGTNVYLRALAKSGPTKNPFQPIENLGEDISFCYRIKDEVDMWCDSRIKVPHIGMYDYTENDLITEGTWE